MAELPKEFFGARLFLLVLTGGFLIYYAITGNFWGNRFFVFKFLKGAKGEE